MAVGVIVHAENPLESLPLDEARSIFCGEVKKWPPVRGVAAPMHVLGLPQTSPITQLLREKLALTPALSQGERGAGTVTPKLSQGERVTAAPKALRFTAQADSEKVLLAVARDPAAIGFVDLGRLPAKEKSVKLVRIVSQASGKQGGHAAAISADGLPEDYPLARTLTLSVSPSASRTAIDFAEFLTREHCKETIARHNLLPPLHAPDPSQFAKAALPRRNDPQIQLASANCAASVSAGRPRCRAGQAAGEDRDASRESGTRSFGAGRHAQGARGRSGRAVRIRGRIGGGKRASAGAVRSAVAVRQSSGLDRVGRCRGGRFGHRGGLAERVETEEEAALKVDQSP